MPLLRVATRGSRLALAQTRHVCRRLAAVVRDLTFEEVVVRTKGDRDQDSELAQMSRAAGIGFFVREVEQALLDGRADLAVHSLKDLPVEEHPALVLAAVPDREDPRDALAPAESGEPDPLARLPRGARVGTGSPRRKAQILQRRPDLEVVPVRGNVPTRLDKARDPQGELDAVVLALAGLRRLGLEDQAAALPLEDLLPAAGQGALGLQCRREDDETWELLEEVEDEETRCAVEAERAFLGRLQGGCSLPAGALARMDGETLHLEVRLTHPDGTRSLRARREGDAEDALDLGISAAEELLESGAEQLLEDLS